MEFADIERIALYAVVSFNLILMFAVYGINSILYQRGIYPPETFTRVQKYGLTILVTADDELKKYLTNILADVKGWLPVIAVKVCTLLDILYLCF